MNKYFSWPLIRQAISRTWICTVVFVVIISLNFFALPTLEIPDTELIVLFSGTAIEQGNGMILVTIAVILFSNILITGPVDRGTLVITLTTPTTRKQFLFSNLLVISGALITICLGSGLLGMLAIIIYQIDVSLLKWWLIIFLWTSYSCALAAITFFLAATFNKSKYLLLVSSGVLAAFFLFRVLSFIESLEALKYLSLQSLFDSNRIILGQSVLPHFLVLWLITVPCLYFGVRIFCRKDLAL